MFILTFRREPILGNVHEDSLERVLISFCLQPNPPVIYCAYVVGMLIIK